MYTHWVQFEGQVWVKVRVDPLGPILRQIWIWFDLDWKPKICNTNMHIKKSHFKKKL
jgi:hypothetical protein